MRITKYMTGPIQANTYLVYDEEQKKGLWWIRADMNRV